MEEIEIEIERSTKRTTQLGEVGVGRSRLSRGEPVSLGLGLHCVNEPSDERARLFSGAPRDLTEQLEGV